MNTFKTKISIFALFFLLLNISYSSITAFAEWISIDGSISIPVTITETVTNGACGTASGTTISTAPTDNLCTDSSTGATVSGSGPWTWTCLGSGSGATNATCSAYKTVETTTTTSSSGGGGGGSYYTPTCTDSQLECINNIYTVKSGNSCTGGNLGKTCSITSTQTGTTQETSTGTIQQTTSSGSENKTNTTPSGDIKSSDGGVIIDTTEKIDTVKKVETNGSIVVQLGNTTNTTFKEEVTVNVKVDTEAEYKVSKVENNDLVEKAKVTPKNSWVTFTAETSGIYFIDPLKDIKTVTLQEETISSKSCKSIGIIDFTDIENSFAKDYIKQLNKLGVVNGYNDKTFRPNNNATRAEFLKMALCTFGYGYEGTDTSKIMFSDINKDSWQAGVVAKGLELGILDIRNTNFRPNNPISRIEALKIVTSIASKAKVEKLKNLSPEVLDLTLITWENATQTPFSDINMPWMTPFLKTTYDLGIISGQEVKGNLIFRPNNAITRAEVSKILYQTLQIK